MVFAGNFRRKKIVFESFCYDVVNRKLDFYLVYADLSAIREIFLIEVEIWGVKNGSCVLYSPSVNL